MGTKSSKTCNSTLLSESSTELLVEEKEGGGEAEKEEEATQNETSQDRCHSTHATTLENRKEKKEKREKMGFGLSQRHDISETMVLESRMKSISATVTI